MEKKLKILVIRFSSIGDIVLTTPVVRCLRQQLNAEIHYLTKVNFASIVAPNPHINKVWTIQKNVHEVAKALQKERFDVVVDLHKNLRTLQTRLLLRTRTLSFQKLNFEKWLMVNFKINRLPNVHIVERYLAAIEPLGVYNDGSGLDYFIPPESKVNLNDFGLQPLQYVAFAIGAAHATKRLPNEKIVEICQKMSLPVVLLGGKEDHANGEIVATACGEKQVANLCGKLSLHQSASMVQQAAQVVTHDTGLMHIAAAFHKKIISIWGSTVPAFGMIPYLQGSNNISFILEVEGLPCRPCSKIGYNQCPKGHFKCMQAIVLDRYKIDEIINKSL